MTPHRHISSRPVAPAWMLILAAVALIPLWMNAKGNSWDDEARKRKADYMYLEALRVNSQHSRAEDVYMLLRRAALLSPSDIHIGAELGFYESVIAVDSAMRSRGIQRLKTKFDSNPEDFFWSSIYANQIRQPSNLAELLRVEGILDSIYPNKTELTLRYADDLGALAASGDSAALAKAMSVLDRVERASGNEPWLTSRRIRILSAVSDTAGIIAEIHKLLADNPLSSTNNLLAGSIYAFLEENDSAIHYINRACELDPTNSDAIITRAEFYNQSGDSAAYDAEVFNALKLSTLDVETKTDILTHYVRELYSDTTPAQQDRINDLFGVLIDQHPHEAPIHYLYGSYLALMHNYAQAAEQFRYSTDLSPTNTDGWRMLISTSAQAEDYDGIVEATERAREFFPDEYWWYLMEALAYSNLGQDMKGIEIIDLGLEKATVDDNIRSQLLSTKGDILYSADMPDSSFVYYKMAIDLDPSNATAMNNAAYHLAELGENLEQAEAWASAAVGLAPENSTFLDTYAWVYFKRANYAEAKVYIDKALAEQEADEDGLSSDIISHAGDIYFMSGLPDEALDFWKKALELDPDNELLQRKVAHKTFYYK